jgi:DMSO/TMAO reductase YedYZ heme-binding membrane subunit
LPEELSQRNLGRMKPLLVGATLSLVAALVALAEDAPLAEGLASALRLTGRLSFVLFLAVFVASPLAERGTAWGRRLRSQRRALGLTLAGAHATHLGLIVALLLAAPATRFPWIVVVFGGLGFVVLAALAVTSFPGPAKRLGGAAWRRLHSAGVWYLSFIFAYDFLLKPSLHGRLGEPRYAAFAAMLTVAYGLRLDRAWRRARSARRSANVEMRSAGSVRHGMPAKVP